MEKEDGNPPKKMAILVVHADVLRELFQLPKGAEVVDLRVPVDRRGVIEIKIEGAGWLTGEGVMIQRTAAEVTRNFDAAGVETNRTIDWKLPSN